MREIGIYVHIPFCKQKCYYCDFKSYANKEELIEKYIKWLKYEIKEVGEGNKLDYENDLDDLVTVKTIYIGGGTPSYLDSKYIKEIVEEIRENFKLADKVEITIEVNPGTVNKTKLLDYINSGINRISIGLQSTDNELLKRIGRIHKYEDFLQTYNMAREVGFKNINVDLMLALPGQTIAKLEKGLKQVIDLQPEHISLYSLIIEDGTKIEKMLKNNEITLPDENIERKMYWEVKKQLEKAGYVHYEISNFAKPGYESKHNLSCWNQEEYLGFGIAAHSYFNGERYSNTEDFDKYFEHPEDSKIIHEKQTQEDKQREFMLLGLRKIEGVKISDFKNKFIENPIYLYRESLSKLVTQGLIEIDIDSIRLTNRGIDLANLVWEEFV